MKICVVSYNHEPYFGGIETYSKYLYEFLDKSQMEFEFISGNITKNKIIRIFEVIIIFFKKILMNNRYDVIHITNLNLWPILLISNLTKNMKFIVNLHGLELVYGKRNKLNSKLFEFLIPYKFINKNKNIFFVLERFEVKNNNDIINLNEIWSIKFNTLNSSTEKKLK